MTINQKEQDCLDNLKNTIDNDTLWAENYYIDCDDPYSEPLISWGSLGVGSSYTHLLHHLLDNIPEHKLSTIGMYLRAKIVIAFILKDNTDYIQHYSSIYFNDFHNKEFMKNFYELCYSSFTQETFPFFLKNSEFIDPQFTFLKTHLMHLTGLINIINKIDLHNSLDEQLSEKKENLSKLKI